MPKYEKQTIDGVCPYQYFECLKIGDCPLSFTHIQNESPVEWGKRIEREAGKCQYSGASLSRKGYEGRYKLIPV